MFIRNKAYRFYFFIVAYCLAFASLAFFGTVEIENTYRPQKIISQKTMDQIAAITKNKALYSLPRMDVTVPSIQGPDHHLRLGINLQIDIKNLDQFADFQPRVSDRIVGFLNREDVASFQGPNGLQNLRNSLLFEANQASGPILISDIIFREFVLR